MKEYHTSIEINAPIKEVWSTLTDFDSYPEWNPLVSKLEGNIAVGGKIHTTIAPLNDTFSPTLLSYKESEEIVWEGHRVAKFVLAGKHYYRLKEHTPTTTLLEHGEFFTGLFSAFIPSKLLIKMKEAFVDHNVALKNRVEHGN